MEMNFASKGAAATGIALGASALGVSVLKGGLGALFSGVGGCDPNSVPVTRYELGLQQELVAKDSKIALLESNIYTDSKIADVYERLNGRIACVEAQICQQNVVNAQVTANLACMQSTIATLSGLTKTVVPITSICPTPAVATTAPATGA